MMKRWTVRRIAIGLLGLLLCLGIGLSAVQAGNMAVRMALADDMGSPGGCAGCGGDEGVKAGNCVSICASSIFTLPAPTAFSAVAMSQLSFSDRTEPLRSTASSPEPYPPKPAILL